jgi:hypothetical protein
MRQAAAEERIALIQLNAMSKPFYEALGPVDAHSAFAGRDTAHHENYGSYEVAKYVAQATEGGKSPLANYLIDLPPLDLARPDPVASFAIPADPTARGEPPYGK